MEKTNIRYVTPEDLGEPIDFSSIDVSFISLTKVLLPIYRYLTEGGEIVVLIKPQFEAGREKVEKGVVREKSTPRRSDPYRDGLRRIHRIYGEETDFFSDQRTGGEY